MLKFFIFSVSLMLSVPPTTATMPLSLQHFLNMRYEKGKVKWNNNENQQDEELELLKRIWNRLLTDDKRAPNVVLIAKEFSKSSFACVNCQLFMVLSICISKMLEVCCSMVMYMLSCRSCLQEKKLVKGLVGRGEKLSVLQLKHLFWTCLVILPSYLCLIVILFNFLFQFACVCWLILSVTLRRMDNFLFYLQ